MRSVVITKTVNMKKNKDAESVFQIADVSLQKGTSQVTVVLKIKCSKRTYLSFD